MSDPSPVPGKLHLRARHLLFEIVCGDIQKTLAAAGIPMLVLKGPHVGMTVYEDSTERRYGDLDILVRPEHYPAAAQILLNCGFTFYQVNRRRLASESADYQLLLRSPRGVAVELHRALADTSQFHSDVEGFFQRSEEFKFGELSVRGLGTEDLLLHLCLHFGKRHFMTCEKKHLQDIALLLGKKPIDWKAFLKGSKRTGCRIIAYYSLKAVSIQYNMTMPREVEQELRPLLLSRMILQKLIDPAKFPIYRFPGNVPGIRERIANLLLLDRIQTMLNSMLVFSRRAIMNRMLGIGFIRSLWQRCSLLNRIIVQAMRQGESAAEECA